MRQLLSAAGRAFLRAFAGALVVYGAGILSAPGLADARLVGVAALLAAFAAGLRAVQAYVPALDLSEVLPGAAGRLANAFALGFLGSLLVTLPGVLDAPDLGAARSLASAALVGAFAAGARGLEGALSAGEGPARSLGLPPPRKEVD